MNGTINLKRLNSLDVYVNDHLSVQGNSVLRGDVLASGKVIAEEGLNVYGNCVVEQNLTIRQNAIIEGALSVSRLVDDLAIQGCLSVSEPATLVQELSVGGGVSISKDLCISGSLSVTGDTHISGETTFTGKSTIFSGNLITRKSTCDIGSPEHQFRNMFLGDNIWIGDESRISISKGKMTFRKRKPESVPMSILEAGQNAGHDTYDVTAEEAKKYIGVESLSEMKISHWQKYMRFLQPSASLSDIFRDDDTEYEETMYSDNWKDIDEYSVFTRGRVGIGLSDPLESMHVRGSMKIEQGFSLERIDENMNRNFVMESKTVPLNKTVFDQTGQGIFKYMQLYSIFGRADSGEWMKWHWGYADDCAKQFSLSYTEPNKADPNVSFIFNTSSELFCKTVHANLRGIAEEAKSARKLTLPQKINGVEFDGTKDIELKPVYDITAPLIKYCGHSEMDGINDILSGPRPGTNSGGAMHYINGSERLIDGGANTYTITNSDGDLRLGNSSHTTTIEGTFKLSNPVKINGVTFDGSSDITLPTTCASSAKRLEKITKINGTDFNGTSDILINGISYDVNNKWLSILDKDDHFKVYGNENSVVFRTDGMKAFGNNGAYPFIWLFGGDNVNSNRKMVLDENGALWTEQYGWFHEKFSEKEGCSEVDHNCKDIHVNGWVNFKSTSSGMYWETTSNGNGWKVFPTDPSQMVFKTGTTSKFGGICGALGSDIPRGYINWTADNQIGFMNCDKSWCLQVNRDKSVRCFSKLCVDGHLEIGRGQKNVRLSVCEAEYGTVDISLTNDSGWGGYVINNNWGFVSDSSNIGLFCNRKKEWGMKCVDTGETNLFFDGSCKLSTSNCGIVVYDDISAKGSVYARNDTFITGRSPSTQYVCTEGFSSRIMCESNKLFFMRSDKGGTTWSKRNGQWPLSIDLFNNDCNVGGCLASDSIKVKGESRICTDGRGKLYISGRRHGNFMRLNDEMWVHDSKNGPLEFRDAPGGRIAELKCDIVSDCDIKSRKLVQTLTTEEIDGMYNEALNMNLVTFYKAQDSPGFDARRLGFELRPGRPSYLHCRHDQDSYSESHWISILHAASKVIDANVKYLLEYCYKSMDFTGKHRTLIKGKELTQYEKYEGLIVCANCNKYLNDTVTIDNASPIVQLSTQTMDKSVFGVVSKLEKKDGVSHHAYMKRQVGDIRLNINSVGEGGIWVCDSNGTLESGDYITSSQVPGYGMKQESEFLANYSVAKVTMDCDFERYRDMGRIIKQRKTKVEYFVKDVETVADDRKYMSWDPKLRFKKEVRCYRYSFDATCDKPDQETTKSYVLNGEVVDTDESLLKVQLHPNDWYRLPESEQGAYSLVHQKKIDKYISVEQYEDGLKCGTDNEWKDKWTEDIKVCNFVVHRLERKTRAPGYKCVVREEVVNDLDSAGNLQWEDSTHIKERYPMRYILQNGNQISQDEYETRIKQNKIAFRAVFVGCTYHCG